MKKTKLNISSEARGKIMATVADGATSSYDRSGMHSINKEEEDRTEYTHIIPSRPWKKKKIKKRRMKEDTCIRLLAQPTDEPLGLIGDNNTTVDEAIR